jgi:V8-like Glu-specific endopeptidase
MRLFLAFLIFAIAPLALSAQSLPQISQNNSPRPLQTWDAARGWEAVGRLDTGVSFCSATLIAPDLVLTAAHCLFAEDNRRIPDSDLVFFAGLRQGRAEATRRVILSVLPQAYRPMEGPPQLEHIGADVALLRLDQPILSGNVVPIGVGPQGRVRDLVTVVSYGRDRETSASIQEDCEIVGREESVSALSCSVVAGASGSPILRETAAGFEVVAIVSAMGDWNGRDAAFAVDLDRVLPALVTEARASTNAMAMPANGRVTLRQPTGDGGRSTLGARFIRP